VRDASDALTFIAGLECDGASFHCLKTVRDRDWRRQQILEQRGWKMLRIWSTDWFEDPRRELSRVHAQLLQLRSGLAAAH
jgi:very-short-patch-repair endonuclease